MRLAWIEQATSPVSGERSAAELEARSNWRTVEDSNLCGWTYQPISLAKSADKPGSGNRPGWSSLTGLNCGPPLCGSGALPAELSDET